MLRHRRTPAVRAIFSRSILRGCSSLRNASCSSEGSSETEEQMRSTPPRISTHAGIPPTHEGCVLCHILKRGSEAGATPPFHGIPFGSPAPGAHLAPFGKEGKSIFRSRQSRVLNFRRWKGRRILVRDGRQSWKKGLPEIERPFFRPNERISGDLRGRQGECPQRSGGPFSFPAFQEHNLELGHLHDSSPFSSGYHSCASQK